MTLAEIMRLALRQLDEDPADIAEFAELFKMWANQGYQIIQQQYYKPRETVAMSTDDKGETSISGMNVALIASLRDENGHDVWYERSADGSTLKTTKRNGVLEMVFETQIQMLEQDTDEPAFPEHAHSMLVDYICYKQLMRGNMAKQNRAQAFQSEFYRAAQQLKPQGYGSVTGMKGLYTASDIRYTRW